MLPKEALGLSRGSEDPYTHVHARTHTHTHQELTPQRETHNQGFSCPALEGVAQGTNGGIRIEHIFTLKRENFNRRLVIPD